MMENPPDPNTIWAQETNLEHADEIISRLPFTPWVRYVTEQRLLPTLAAMDRVIKCARIWNATDWTMCNASFHRHFLRVQKELVRRGILALPINQVHSPLCYPVTMASLDITRTSFHQTPTITFLDCIPHKSYSKWHAKYLFSTRRGNTTFRRPTEFYKARGDRIYTVPTASEASTILAYCFFHDNASILLAGEEEFELPLQIQWMVSILGITPAAFFDWNREFLNVICPIVDSGNPWISIHHGWFTRFYDGVGLVRELRQMYLLVLSLLPGEEEEDCWTPLNALKKRSHLIKALQTCSSPLIQQQMVRTEFGFVECLDSSSDIPLMEGSYTLDQLRLDRCFPGDGVISGNYQSRLFVVVLWSCILFSDILENSRLLVSMDSFKLCVSSLLIRFANTPVSGGDDEEEESEPENFLFRTLCLAREAMMQTGDAEHLSPIIDQALRDVFYYSLLLVNFFQGTSVSTIVSLDRLFSEQIMQIISVSHVSAVAISQQLEWPPYGDYRQLVKSILPHDIPASLLEERSSWKLVYAAHFQHSIEMLAYSIRDTYGFFLYETFLRATEAVQNELSIVTFPTTGYASTIPLLDAVHYIIGNVLYFQRIYEWWRPETLGGDDDEEETSFPSFLHRSALHSQAASSANQGMDSSQDSESWEEEEMEHPESGVDHFPASMDSTDECMAAEFIPGEESCIQALRQSFSPVFSTASVSLDSDEPVILPKATFLVLPVPMGEHQSGWVCRWGIDRSRLLRIPFFDFATMHHGEEEQVDAFIQKHGQRFHDILKFGSYMLFRTNEAISLSKKSGKLGKYLPMPAYPVLAPMMERTYHSFRWTRCMVNAEQFDDMANIVTQTLDAMTGTEAFLAIRTIETSIFPEMDDILRQPAQYQNSMDGLFFLLSIPHLWTLLYDGYIKRGELALASSKLRKYFRLFSSYESNKPIQIPADEEDPQAYLSTIFTRAVRIRGRTGKDGIFTSFCPTLIELIGEDCLDLSSCSSRLDKKGKKKEEPWGEKDPFHDDDDEDFAYFVSEDSEESSVEFQGHAPAKWFFFSHLDWSQLIGYCIEHLWTAEDPAVMEEKPSKFALLVLELFMHGYSSDEFYTMQEEAQRGYSLASDVPRECTEQVYEWIRIGLSHCGYAMSYDDDEEEEEEKHLQWNPFGCVLLLLEYGTNASPSMVMEEMMYMFCQEKRRKEDRIPFLMDYLTRTTSFIDDGEKDSLSTLLDNAPVELSLLIQRKGVDVRTVEEDTIHSFQVRRYGDMMFLPERLPGLGWQHFSGRNISSFAADMLYLFGRTRTGFL